jgi:hypothetical protein
VAYTHNPSYLEGGDGEDGGWRMEDGGQLGQKVHKTPYQPITKLGMVVHTCLPSHAGSQQSRLALSYTLNPILSSEMSWRAGNVYCEHQVFRECWFMENPWHGWECPSGPQTAWDSNSPCTPCWSCLETVSICPLHSFLPQRRNLPLSGLSDCQFVIIKITN